MFPTGAVSHSHSAAISRLFNLKCPSFHNEARMLEATAMRVAENGCSGFTMFSSLPGMRLKIFSRYSSVLPLSYLKFTGTLSLVSSSIGAGRITPRSCSPLSFKALCHLFKNCSHICTGMHSLSMSAGVDSMDAPSIMYSENNMSLLSAIC